GAVSPRIFHGGDHSILNVSMGVGSTAANDPVDRFDVVDVINVGLHELATRLDALAGFRTKLGGGFKTLPDSLAARIPDFFRQGIHGTGDQSLVGQGHRLVDLPGRLQAGVGSAFTFAVQ